MLSSIQTTNQTTRPHFAAGGQGAVKDGQIVARNIGAAGSGIDIARNSRDEWIAAGNQGELARSLGEMGVKTSPETFRSILLNDWVTVVGAATAQGTPASLNSPDSGVEVYALGENVPVRIHNQTGLANGTSVSTPLIASQAAATFKAHPDWTPHQLEQEMLYRP